MTPTLPMDWDMARKLEVGGGGGRDCRSLTGEGDRGKRLAQPQKVVNLGKVIQASM